MGKGPFQTDHRVTPGEVIEHASDIRAITAPNAAPMTFTGTQTYLLGKGSVALIDPGPVDAQHKAAIEAALRPGETIEAVLITHSHLDHSPMAGAFGVAVYGFGAHDAARAPIMNALGDVGGGEGIDMSFAPDRIVGDGDWIEGQGWAVEVIHTPGHLSNHISFASGDRLFSGDHVMGWASTLISPPDGDLSAYLASMDKLMARNFSTFYPGHGAPVTAPEPLMRWLVAHRREREAQVLALLLHGPHTVGQITAALYADVDPKLHGAASRNVLAHIIDLYARGKVLAGDGFDRDAAFRLLQER